VSINVEITPHEESFSFLHSLQGASEGKQYVLTQQGKLLMSLPSVAVVKMAFSLKVLLNYDIL
jgi:hypothetical protein